MSEERPPEAGTKTRTRQAIVSAAIRLMGEDPSVALGDIAAAAAIGRTTLHRYFPDRSSLLAAIQAEVVAGIGSAVQRARTGEGAGAEALRRLCREYFELGDLLNVVFTEVVVVPDDVWVREGTDDTVLGLVRRGHQDGSINPLLTPEWLQSVLWSLLYAGWSYVKDGTASKHETLDLILRTLKGAVAP